MCGNVKKIHTQCELMHLHDTIVRANPLASSTPYKCTWRIFIIKRCPPSFYIHYRCYFQKLCLKKLQKNGTCVYSILLAPRTFCTKRGLCHTWTLPPTYMYTKAWDLITKFRIGTLTPGFQTDHAEWSKTSVRRFSSSYG